MIDAPPFASRRPLDDRGVAARPPLFIIRRRAHQRVARMVFPRPIDRFRACRDDHVAGRRAGRAADREDEVEVFAVPQNLGALGRKALDVPFRRVVPRIVDVFRLTDTLQTIVAEAHPVATAEEQPARTVLADDVVGVDVFGHVEVDRIRPRASDAIGPDDVDAGLGARDRFLGRDVEKIAAVMLGQGHGPNRADVFRQRRGNRLPVHQVARMPDDHAGIGIERRERHVVVGAVLEDRGIRMVAGHDRIKKSAIAEIGLALIVEGPAPVRSLRRLHDMGLSRR